MRKKEYRMTVYEVAEEQGVKFADVKDKLASKNNAPNALVTTYPNGLLKAVKPFTVLGAKVDFTITCDNGTQFNFKFEK